jgi:hypothetical protein
MGTFGATFEFNYDVNVLIDAPPADQVVTPSAAASMITQ